MSNLKRCGFGILLLAFAVAMLVPALAMADESEQDSEAAAPVSTQVFYLETSTVNAGHDTGYSKDKAITAKDPHYGWDLGRFYVSGYTSKTGDDTPIFLKNVGDEVALRFTLDQDIDRLNDNGSLSISQDKNGYDERLEIPKTDFGRGAVFVLHSDYQNTPKEPVKYLDFLSGVSMGADTQVGLYEEGDYTVVFDYEIKNSPRNVLGRSILPKYTDYRTVFKFKVRNGNTMFYLLDAETGNELFDGSTTMDGFRVDTAQSHYLELSATREVMNETKDGLKEDARFNKAISDGAEFTDPGVYTVKVRNPTTNETTEKQVYVGDDEVLMASVANKMTVVEVRQQMDMGATVSADGTLVQTSYEVEEEAELLGDSDSADGLGVEAAEEGADSEVDAVELGSSAPEASAGIGAVQLYAIMGLIAAVTVAVAVVVYVRKRKTGAYASAVEGAPVPEVDVEDVSTLDSDTEDSGPDGDLAGDSE